LIEEWGDIRNNDGRKLTMFKILELKRSKFSDIHLVLWHSAVDV
jgi:hypothetical protein